MARRLLHGSYMEKHRTLSVLGVKVTDATSRRAIDLLQKMIRRPDGRTHSVFFVNAHTLNLADQDKEYRQVLDTADHVFGDGTGVRWATRMQGAKLQDNLCGTDLVPELFKATAGRGYRYFLLGADENTIGQAAKYAAESFTGWKQVGQHHGYLSDPKLAAEVIRRINRARPHMLLVGMGNPLQERWIRQHQHQLEVPVCMAIGGLFDFWAGNVSRSPLWLRAAGHEWLWRLWQQPRDKAKRYLFGNPQFMMRAVRDALIFHARRLGKLYSVERLRPVG